MKNVIDWGLNVKCSRFLMKPRIPVAIANTAMVPSNNVALFNGSPTSSNPIRIRVPKPNPIGRENPSFSGGFIPKEKALITASPSRKTMVQPAYIIVEG